MEKGAEGPRVTSSSKRKQSNDGKWESGLQIDKEKQTSRDMNMKIRSALRLISIPRLWNFCKNIGLRETKTHYWKMMSNNIKCFQKKNEIKRNSNCHH